MPEEPGVDVRGAEMLGDGDSILPAQWAGIYASPLWTPMGKLGRALIEEALLDLQGPRSGYRGAREEHRAVALRWVQELDADWCPVSFRLACGWALPMHEPEVLQRAILQRVARIAPERVEVAA